jgi:hypothetical protein
LRRRPGSISAWSWSSPKLGNLNRDKQGRRERRGKKKRKRRIKFKGCTRGRRNKIKGVKRKKIDTSLII